MMEQRYESDFYICGMQSIKDLGPMGIRTLIDRYGEPYEAWKAIQDPNNLRCIGRISEKDRLSISQAATDELLERLYAELMRWNMEWVTYRDVLFPGRLQEIYNPPAVLFLRGNRKLLDDDLFKVAMVGARKCSAYGKNVARYFGRKLSDYELAIVSGGARGIDSYGHEGALSNHGKAIVVMGCGLDIVYPPENKRLFDEVVAGGGLLVSEFPPGVPPSSRHFPIRNRIISGLSHAVIVVEARSSSGSLITADMANSEGRDVYVIPGSVLDNWAEGNHWLIRQGANVLMSPQDLREDYNLRPRCDTVETDGDSVISCKLEARIVLQSIPTDRCISVNELMRITRIPLSRLQRILLDLELSHAVEHLQPHGYIVSTNRSDIVVN